MSNFSINEMQSMQKELQDKYKEKWERICPETGKNKFLWMIGEIGEVIDIIKKNGDKSAVADSSVREHLIEDPFAAEVTKNVEQACRMAGTEYIRCVRERQNWDDKGERVVRVESVPEAVEYLQNTTGNVLIATGSKELKEYTRIAGCKERCYARVLSTQVSVEESIRLGFEGKHLIAMQGPFSKELNLAMLRALDARYFVTKESGKSGGFLEKVQAAEEAKAVLVVVGRPFEVGKILKETKKFLEIWAGLC